MITNFIKIVSLFIILLGVSSCGSSSGGGGCDLVANAGGPAYFEVENNLSSGLEWTISTYAFGADMKPGECTRMGVASRQHTVELQQCTIGSAACTSSFGPIRTIVFDVLDGDTYTLEVNSGFF